MLDSAIPGSIPAGSSVLTGEILVEIRKLAQYTPSGLEEKWYAAWDKAGLFAPDPSASGKPFVITLPPPNGDTAVAVHPQDPERKHRHGTGGHPPDGQRGHRQA